jgi:thiamine biosynthesis lipoprotein
MKRARKLLAILALVATCTKPGQADGTDAVQERKIVALEGRTMGTTYHIKYRCDNGGPRDDVHHAVDEFLAAFDRQMSTYRDDSELSRFNRAAPGEWFPVSHDAAAATAAALRISQQTDGALDVTIGPVLRLWGFGPGAKHAGEQAVLHVPTSAQIGEALRSVGPQHVEVRLDPPALKKDAAGVQIELSSIAPGYAVDLLIERLAKRGVVYALV